MAEYSPDTLTIRLPKRLENDLRDYCKHEHCTLDEAVARLVQIGMQAHLARRADSPRTEPSR
jgi:hypothetical protein